MVVIRIQERAVAEQSMQAVLSFNYGVEYPVQIQDPFAEDTKQETDLEWYFEEYLTFPFTQDVRAKNAAKSIRSYGASLFAQVFADTNALFAYKQARQQGLHTLQIEIAGSSAFQRLHWEAFYDPEFEEYLALRAAMVRKNIVPQISPATMQPATTINVLVVVARPGGARDVGYRTISRPLMDELERTKLPVEVTLLRPGTYQALVTHLEQVTRAYGVGHYHLIHFDVHGALLDHAQLEGGAQANRYLYSSRFGRPALAAYPGEKAFLFLEGEQDEQFDPVEAGELVKLLLQHQIPIVLLNACQSGKLSGEMETSLGNQLVQAGVQTVVAMGYSVTVSAAEVLMQALYQALFVKKPLPEALCLARQALANRKERRVFFNQIIELEDWLLPILYQNQEVQFALQPFTPQAEATFFEVKGAQYREPQHQRPTYGFVGRDVDILQIEKRLLLKRNLLLVRGMGGAGKTTLLHHLASWWQRTGLVHEVFYFGYNEKAWSRQQIMHTIARKLLDKYELLTFQSMSQEAQQARLAQLLKSTRHLLILDNLESVTGAPLALRHTLKPKERESLRRFLSELAGGQTFVLLGSRSAEEWLAKGTFEEQCYELSGLDQEAASQLAERILERHHATQYRQDKDLPGLLKLLDGFPLALEVVLANLVRQTPAEVLAALQQGDTLLQVGTSEERTENVLKCVEYSYCNLSPDAQQLLLCLAPFTSVIWQYGLYQYAQFLQAQPTLATLPFEKWQEVIQETEKWGLLTSDPDIPLFLHLQPVLPYFLRHRLASQEELRDLQIAVEEAFYEYYNLLSRIFYIGLQSRQAQERHIGQSLIHAEYENLFSALRFALHEKKSVRDIYSALSAYLNYQREYQSGQELDKLLFSSLESLLFGEMNREQKEEWLPILGAIADRQLALQQYEAAQNFLQINLQMIENEDLDDHKGYLLPGAIYQNLGIIAGKQQHWDQAEQYLQHTLEIYIEHKDRYHQAGTYHNLGWVAQEQGHWEQAEQYYQQALEIFIECKDRYEQAKTYNQLGRIAEKQGCGGQAEQYYQQALQIFVEDKARYEQAKVYHSLGVIAQMQEHWGQAEQYYQQALQIYIEDRVRDEQAEIYRSLGRLAEEQQRWEQAEQYYQHTLEIYIEYRDRYEQAGIYHSLGKVVQEQQHWEQAKEHFLEAFRIFVEREDFENSGITLRSLAHLWLVRKEPDLIERVASILGLAPDEIEKLFREITASSSDRPDETGS